MYCRPMSGKTHTVSAKRKSHSNSAESFADLSSSGLAQCRRDALLGPPTIQATTAVAQCERTVTNRMKANMKAALARVFGGPASRYEIDQDSGTTFSDGEPNFTTGHHGVGVTDTLTGTTYSCDFHQDGAYYTRD